MHGSPRLLDITLDAYRTFGVTLIGEMDGRATGEMMAIDKDAPSVQLIRSPEHKHTDGDIPALVPAAGLEAVARAFAKIIDQVNTLDLAELQPGLFCEVDKALAEKRGLENGKWATIVSPRGVIEAQVLVTDRMQMMMINGDREAAGK